MNCCNFFKDNQYHIEIYKPLRKVSLSQQSEKSFIQAKTMQGNPIALSSKTNHFQNSISSGSSDLSSKSSFERVSSAKAAHLFGAASSEMAQTRRGSCSYCKEYAQQWSTLGSKKIKQDEINQFLSNKHITLEKQTIETNQAVVRMIKKSDYEQVLKTKTLKRWTDAQFKEQKQFCYSSTKKYSIYWRSLQDFRKQTKGAQYNFITKPISTTDVLQGEIGTCYFLSSIATLTSSKRPERILKLFPSVQMNSKGIFMARLMIKGIIQEIVVDDSFPFYKNKNGNLQLLGCKPTTDDNQIYTLVLEKCWAKAFKSYENIHGGYAHQALHAMTGALTKCYNIDKQTESSELDNLFFNQILEFHQNDYLMCAGTDNFKSQTSKVLIEGKQVQIKLAQPHIFTITQISNNNGSKMLRIYNPWGKNEDQRGNKLNGEFLIAWKEFKQCFSHLTVCKIRDNANYLHSEFNFQAGKVKFINLNVYDSKTGYFAVTLSETFVKDQSHKYLNVTYMVFEYTSGGFEAITIRSQYKHADHYLELHGLKKGKYLIAIYISDQHINEALTFGVYSQDSFGFAEQKFDQDFTDNFIPQVLIKHEEKKEKMLESRIYPQKRNKQIWFSLNIIERSRLGYLILHVGPNEKGYQLVFCRKAFEEYGLATTDPYNKQMNTLTTKAGLESVCTLVVENVQVFMDKFESNLAKIHQQIMENSCYI